MEEEFVLRERAALAELERMFLDFPGARVHRDALRILRSDFSFARKYNDGSWAALIKFGPNITAMFGLTRDVMVIYSPEVDLQPRTLASFPTRTFDLGQYRMCEDHLVIISSRDPFEANKLENWSRNDPFVGISWPFTNDPARSSERLLREMKRKLATRNLYDETLPVTGRDFFGRRQLLTQLQEEIRQGNVCGVFGLRKTGKTSLIKELGARFTTSEASRIFVLRDLETLPMDSPRLGVEFVQDLREAFLAEFRPRGVRTGDLTDLGPSASVGELRRALQASLTDCSKRGIQVVLALDEIEYLVGDSTTLAEASRPEVPEILGALRSLVQENDNFNVLMSGITSAVMHRGSLYGVENPLFSWAKSYYIPPMPRAEITALTTEVGLRMGIRWDEAALAVVYAQSEGHVFLHRTLAASVVSHVAEDQGIDQRVTVDHVARAIPAWKRRTSERLQQMFESFRRHYPTEAELLDTLIAGDVALGEVEAVFPGEVRRLLELDLVVESSDGELRLGAVSTRLRDVRFA